MSHISNKKYTVIQSQAPLIIVVLRQQELSSRPVGFHTCESITCEAPPTLHLLHS